MNQDMGTMLLVEAVEHAKNLRQSLEKIRRYRDHPSARQLKLTDLAPLCNTVEELACHEAFASDEMYPR